MATADGSRAAAEFTVNGTYLETDEGLPEAGARPTACPRRFTSASRAGASTRIVTYYKPRRLGGAGLGLMLSFRTYIGPEIAQVVEPFARLRIAVFRDWPYLLRRRSRLRTPLPRRLRPWRHDPCRRLPWRSHGRRLHRECHYPTTPTTSPTPSRPSRKTSTLSFMVLNPFYLSEFRGQGTYRRFFTKREAHARARNFTYSTFCGVRRPDDHPLRTQGSPAPRSGLAPLRLHPCSRRHRAVQLARTSARPRKTPKPLQFWIKPL